MTIHLWDTAGLDLADRADALALNEAALRYRNSPHGLRRSRYRRLQMEINEQLARDGNREA